MSLGLRILKPSLNPLLLLCTKRPIVDTQRRFLSESVSKAIERVNFSTQKIIQLVPNEELSTAVRNKLPALPLEANWDRPNPIRLFHKTPVIHSKVEGGHYFAGGLPALMQAVQQLEKEPTAPVTYVNDGLIKKSTQSGHQGHVHPSEWTTPDCSALNLMKTLLVGLNVLKPHPPQAVEQYSYLHFPVSIRAVAKNPVEQFQFYGKFFAHRLLHSALSVNGASDDDRWLCAAVRQSLTYHQKLSDHIVQMLNVPTFQRGWRLYWSPNREAILKKKTLWNEVGIQTALLTDEEKRRQTLFKINAPIHALKVFGDGKFSPQIHELVIEFLNKKYPQTFQTRTAVVSEVYFDERTDQPIAVREDGTLFKVSSFLGSPGHNQVFEVDSLTRKELQAWQEVPVSGVSTLWLCTFSRAEFLERIKEPDLQDHQIEARLKDYVASANLTNLHVTVVNCSAKEGNIVIITRITQGANFNSLVADKNDLVNMAENLERFYIGTWKLLSAGTCTRKTAISNVPEFSSNFIHGLSGIGFSFSAAPKHMLQRKPLTEDVISKLCEAFYRKLRI